MASFNPPTQYEIGDWVEFPAFQTISTQKDGKCWLNHQFHGGLKGWGQPFYSGCPWKSYKQPALFQNGELQGEGWHLEAFKQNQKIQRDGLPIFPKHVFTWHRAGLPFGGCAPTRGIFKSNDHWLRIRTTWIMAALQKTEQISTDFSYNIKITIKWGVWPPEGLQLEVHKTKYSLPWPLSFYRGYVHGYNISIFPWRLKHTKTTQHWCVLRKVAGWVAGGYW